LTDAGRVRDSSDGELTLRQLTARALARAETTVVADGRPFLVELARRVLALGHLDATHPDEDALLNPRRSKVDPDCADEALAVARAVTAVELQHAGLLATVVARHLLWRTREQEAGRPAPLLPWLLEDPTAQCLLLRAIVASKTDADYEESQWLLRRLVALYEEERERAPAGPFWPAGPLAACCALGLLLKRPREAPLVTEFRARVESWPGWRDADAWPTRFPGPDLAAQLTERVAAAFGAADRKLWPRAALEHLLEGCWPPLLSFCFRSERPTAESG
jgi:hypothetical protein